MNSAPRTQSNSLNDALESSIVSETVQKPDGSLQTRKYKLNKLIAQGVLSRVYEATDLLTTKKMAVKIINKSLVEEKDAKKTLINAITLQKSLNHSHVVHLDQTFEDTKNIYIIMELCKNQTLRDLVARKSRLTEQEAFPYLNQLVKALKYIHSHKIIHRDIKLEHLFLNDKLELMIGGFGRAVKLKSSKDRRVTIIGPNDSQIYEGSEMSYQTDIKDFAAVMYHLIVGQPYSSDNNFYKYRVCKDIKLIIPCNVRISKDATDLLTTLLDPKSCNKMTLDKILQHPFFADSQKICSTPSFTLSMESEISVQPNDKISCDLSSIPYIQTTNTTSKDHSNSKSSNGKSVTSETFLSSPHNILSKIQDIEIPLPTLTKAISFSDSKPNRSLNLQRGKSEQNISRDLTIGIQKQTNVLGQEEGICVSKWLDYSSKYGIGYILSNGSTGVMYQDCSTIISSCNNQTFEYIETKGQESLSRYNFKDFPDTLQKKVKLYNLFKDHLDQNNSNVCYIEHVIKNNEKNKDCCREKENSNNNALYYVETWIKTDQAIFFKMNTKLVQVVFKDGTVFALSPLDNHIVYICEKGKRYHYKENRETLLKNTEVQQKMLYVEKKLKGIWRNLKTEAS